MNDFELFGERKEIEQINLQDAKSILERGLKHYIGEQMKWLSEYDKVCSWLEDNKRRGLMLFGCNSRGKTVICQKILPPVFKYYLQKECVTIDAKDLSAYNSSVFDSWKLWYNPNPIIIDDVGVESIANYYGERHDVFSEVVDMCEKNSRLLILTTNLTPNEIGERYGLRTLERLKAIVCAIKFQGDSLRHG